MPIKEIEKGRKGREITNDVDRIDNASLGWKRMGKQNSKPSTPGIESVAGSKVERRPVAWDEIAKR